MSELQSVPYQAMDLRDEKQIIAEMQGQHQLIQKYVYSFKQGNQQITSLSYAGIKEAIRRRGYVSITSHTVSETENSIRCIVKVHDEINHIDVLGVAEADKSKPFAFVLATNKAERNAFAKIVPAELISTLIATYLNSEGAETLTETPHPSFQRSPFKKVTATPVTPSTPAETSDPPTAERIVKDGIIWMQSGTTEKAYREENKDNPDYQQIERQLKEAKEAKIKGLAINGYWYFLDSQNDGVLLRQPSRFQTSKEETP